MVTASLRYSGGIVGLLVGGSVKKSSNNWEVKGRESVGGIAGGVYHDSMNGESVIEECQNSGSITGTASEPGQVFFASQTYTMPFAKIGGIVGHGNQIRVSKCENSGQIATNGSGVSDLTGLGGICGDIRGSTVTECYNKGSIKHNSLSNSVGGIVGMATYHTFVSYCYNVGELSGRCNIGGVIGFGAQVDVRYCYNRGTVQGSLNDVGGVAGALRDFDVQSYTNNYLYHCYNFGKVAGLNSSTVYIGTICGFLVYYDVDFCHSLGNSSTIQWGYTANNRSGTDIVVYTDKNTMISAILSQFGSKFKIDNSVDKEGYPVLSWQ